MTTATTTYDYVIVGAGSAGCVLAARLTEDPGTTVALIEAGGPDTDQEIHIPAAFSQQFKTSLDWDFDTEPEAELNGRRAYLPRGKALGGSSSMNAMIYIRGSQADYDGWAANGATGWSWAEVLPYFLKAEDNERGADDFHGAGGPLTVSDGRSNHPLSQAFIAAATQAGYEHNHDFNGKSQFGAGAYQLTQRNGMRCSAAAAYLHPALDRQNLTLYPFTLAHKVLIDNNTARGVEVAANTGDIQQIMANREVIVSAGSYQSPKLLQLSGIGPAALLTAFGIEVVQDLPAGLNLQDHIATVLNYRTSVESLISAATQENAVLLMTEGRGPLTSNIGEAGGFFRSRADLEAPDLQLHFAPVLFHAEGMAAATEHAYAFGPCVLTPASTGQVALRSLRPDAAPRIVHNYLAAEQDRQVLVTGVQICLEIAAQAALKDVTTGPYDVPASADPGEILRWTRGASGTLYHPTSTCAIGAVVDPELRVLGVDGLRVVDASVFPAVPRGNTNAPVIMTAEKAADLVRGGSGGTPPPRKEGTAR